MRVYLVEDSLPIRQGIVRALEEMEGVSVVGKSGSEPEAIAQVLTEAPDLVVIDLQLSTGSGFGVIEALRENKSTARMIVLTNHSTPPFRRQAKRLGIKDFFDKSGEFSKFVETVRRLSRNSS
jgi:DNA-binding NarL/FixJ family response regulator